MSRGMIISIDTVTQVSIKFRKKHNSNKNMVISIEQNTNNTYENGDPMRRWFLVFGLLCRHTASDSITSETGTSGRTFHVTF